MSQRSYAWNIQKQSITVHFNNGDALVWPDTHANFNLVKEAIRDDKPESYIRDLANVLKKLEEAVQPVASMFGAGKVKVTRDGVTFDGRPLHMTICTRIMEHVAENLPVQPLINFLDKLLNGNQSRDAVMSLYDFLEANKIPITEDGDFIVYKRVRDDYLDLHSGTMDNSVGNKLRIPAWEVEADRSRTCAKGLHVCSRQYLPHFGAYGGNRVVICKVNPADVVAVPPDYNNAKMRVCAYEVIGELTDDQKADIFDNAKIVRPGDFSENITWGDNFSEDESEAEPEYDNDDDEAMEADAEEPETEVEDPAGCPDPDCPICNPNYAKEDLPKSDEVKAEESIAKDTAPKPAPWRLGWFGS